MCGIVGWFAAGTSSDVSLDVLERMRDTMEHRGPDGKGTWLSPDRRIGLGFRRLAIIDLSETANQPMSNEDGSIRVVFNGEIYNHVALRRELQDYGHRFQTDHSDTETIVHGYEQWGVDVLSHLEGMFAIGIWDSRKRELLLARDRIGVKPLYFTRTGGHFVFASEIKALLQHPEVSAAVEPYGLYHYLSFLTTPAPLTMFRGIHKLPAGFRAVIREGQPLKAERYWDALPAPRQPDDAAVPATTLQLLEAAVAKRLISDVPFGVFLSGGVDSSAIVALMSRYLNQPVKTFTVGFSDYQHLNELTYARRIASMFKTEHREVMVDEQAMREYLPQLVFSQDEPIADWVCIPLFFVSKLVRDSGTIVVQVGEGSDEQFSGYESYMAYQRLYRRYWRPFRALPRPVQRGLAAAARFGSELTGKGFMYTDILDRAATDREHFWGGAMAFWEPAKWRILNRERWAALDSAADPDLKAFGVPGFLCADTYQVVSSYLGEFDRRQPDADVLARMTYLEFKLRLPELLLMRVDKITMSTSVEARVPFLDHKLVEFTMGIPQHRKVRDGVPKAVLKDALASVLPSDILHRPKMGFGAPMREWLRGDFGKQAEQTILTSRLRSEGFFDYDRIRAMFAEHRAGADCAVQLWALYNLTAWFDHWVAGSGTTWAS